jgi:hypothetical protein
MAGRSDWSGRGSSVAGHALAKKEKFSSGPGPAMPKFGLNLD